MSLHFLSQISSRLKQSIHLISALPKLHQSMLAGLTIALLLLIFLPGNPPAASAAAQAQSVVPDLNQSTEQTLAAQASQPEIAEEPIPSPYPDLSLLQRKEATVKSGDSMALIFSRMGFSANTLHKMIHSGDDAKQLRNIRPGKILTFYSDNADELMMLTYKKSPLEELKIYKAADGDYQAELVRQEVELRQQFSQATIESNFWNAASGAELAPGLSMELAAIFGWDIDFALDLRKGDHFALIYEKKYVNDRYIGDGNIIAARFTNQGEMFEAVRHSDGHYYTPQGDSMRKTFLKAPVHFRYISSNFNPRRLHPVTGKVKPHNGIDYVAPVGTPIMAAGDGKVTASGYNQYNGNYVVLKHSEQYITKYLHLSKRYVKTGQKVSQGKTIGALGGTGRVTGAHLHYEFLVNGVHRNPRTVKLPQAQPIAERDKAEFVATAQSWLTKLNEQEEVMLVQEQSDAGQREEQ